MKVSRSSGYALLAMNYFAKNPDKKIILSQEISRKYDIPLEYLLKILQQLVRASILRSKRGPRGGFSLNKTLKKISMLEIIEAVDGPMSSQLNLMEQAAREKFCTKAEQAYQKATDQAKAVLRKTKIADLV